MIFMSDIMQSPKSSLHVIVDSAKSVALNINVSSGCSDSFLDRRLKLKCRTSAAVSRMRCWMINPASPIRSF